MNMNKALQNLYYAVSGSTTTKVNISKLLVDIHYAITGKESENKNNWSRIINSMADNWPEGGGGSSDFSTAEVTVIGQGGNISGANIYDDENDDYTASYGVLESGVNTVVLYKGKAILYAQGEISVSGSITDNEGVLTVTGDCTITIS